MYVQKKCILRVQLKCQKGIHPVRTYCDMLNKQFQRLTSNPELPAPIPSVLLHKQYHGTEELLTLDEHRVSNEMPEGKMPSVRASSESEPQPEQSSVSCPQLQHSQGTAGDTAGAAPPPMASTLTLRT